MGARRDGTVSSEPMMPRQGWGTENGLEMLLVDLSPITCINCPVTQFVAQTCWILPIVHKQVLFTATAAQLSFLGCFLMVGGEKPEQLQPPRE